MGRTHDVIISGFDLDRLEAELDEMTLRWEQTNDALFAERALADRLAEELESLAWLLWGHERPNTTVTLLRHRLQQALAAWKEARHD